MFFNRNHNPFWSKSVLDVIKAREIAERFTKTCPMPKNGKRLCGCEKQPGILNQQVFEWNSMSIKFRNRTA